MPLSIEFTAQIKAGASSRSRTFFYISADEHLNLRVVTPIEGVDQILRRALADGYLDPDETSFWENTSLSVRKPLGFATAQHIGKFYKEQVTLELAVPHVLQRGTPVSLTVVRHNDMNYKLVFRGEVTEIASVYHLSH